MSLPTVDEVPIAISRLADKLGVVDSESVSIHEARGRILSEPLRADRPSPATDVSAMDGYAIRIADAAKPSLPIAETTCAGSPPAVLHPGTTVRVFTGAAVPKGTECVVKREDTEESDQSIRLQVPLEQLKLHLNVRRRGENTTQGAELLRSGSVLESASIAAVSSFGSKSLKLRRRLRVSILNTGDEILHPGEAVEDWQIRDSNGPTLDAWLAQQPWAELSSRSQVGDRLEEVKDSIRSAIDDSDALVLTGGVSMGDTDFVPAAIQQLGGEIVFHRLPIRPGRPVLGAHLGGKLILGLPGNPVSVAVTSRVVGLPLLRKLAGITPMFPVQPLVQVVEADERQLHLTWFRLVSLSDDGNFRYTGSMGSGDLVSLSRSWGFVEVPAGASGPGPWRLFQW